MGLQVRQIIQTLVDPPAHLSPEAELWAAVLFRAVDDLRGHCCHCPTARERLRLQRDVSEWFSSHRKSEGSFEWVCQIFGFDSQTIRRKLRSTDKNSLRNDYPLNVPHLW